uniref:fimbrial protein n=1 Tax=uncultured Vibrio sp. TaxID=114054 RepID=UPI00262A90B8
MMNNGYKLIFPVVLLSSVGISSVNAADGTIIFTGAVSDQTCTVESSSANLTVDMGTISASAFTAAGDTAGASRFDISLTNCPSFTEVAARFDGVADSVNPDLIAITSTGSEA